LSKHDPDKKKTGGKRSSVKSDSIEPHRTMTEYLAQQGLQSIELESRPNDTVRDILRVQGGQRYEIGDIIAEGGMGKVYKARDLNCRRVVAMKVLTGLMLNDREELLRFIEEAQITAQLEHPNIVPVYEVGLDMHDHIYYTMKMVHGMTLTEILVGIRMQQSEIVEQYPLSRLLNIFQKVCDAVAFAHSKNVVHRDLKPDNIMIGGFGEVVVMDWGLAKVMGTDGNITCNRSEDERKVDVSKEIKVASNREDEIGTCMKTMSGRVMGTPGFMAPEQARAGSVDVDYRSDVYSLGAILYSILTLRSSIKGEDIKEILTRIINGEIIPPLSFNQLPDEDTGEPPLFVHCPGERIPSAISDMVMKAMATEPDDRYQTVQEFQGAVEAYQDGEVWQLIIDDDFSDPEALSRWEIINGEHEFVDEELHIYGGEPQMLMLKADLAGDVRIEFECHQEGVYLNTIGCFLSAVPPDGGRLLPTGGYAFIYGGYDNSLNMLMRGDQKIWSEAASPLQRGEIYNVVVERVGRRLRMSVNDEEIFSFVDADALTGSDRTAVGVFGWLADTYYGRIKIYSLGTPWECDILEMAERQMQKGRYLVAMGLFEEIEVSFPDPERRERAKSGYETAWHRENLRQNLPLWRTRLEQAWPNARINLQLENAGLSLDVANNNIVDLAPLNGMPVTALHCSNNRIVDLEPLRGMPLVALNCSGNPILSLEPLHGMQLNQLFCESCAITSLEALRGMPLTLVNCGGNTSLETGLEPLRGMELTFFSCWGDGLHDLNPLKGMLLTSLYCGGNEITDLSPLSGMPLNMLHCGGNEIEHLDPLRGMQLTSLFCSDNRIVSLEPLRGMLLSIFSCQNNKITTLDPLMSMPLASLTCGANFFTTIGAFIQCPPDIFFFECHSLATKELEWMQQSWARDFRFERQVAYIETLLAMRADDLDAMKKMAPAFNGKKYLFIPRFMSWEDARDYCHSLGGHLLSIHSEAEDYFIQKLFPFGSWFWLGMRSTEDGLKWDNNEPVDFMNFSDSFQARKPGPKVYSGGWCSEDIPNAYNCFMIQWS